MATLTRKHFKIIADEIAYLPNRSDRYVAYNMWLRLGHRFNPNFDSDRFEEACKLEE